MYWRTRILSSSARTSVASSAVRGGRAEKSVSGRSVKRPPTAFSSTYQLSNMELLKMSVQNVEAEVDSDRSGELVENKSTLAESILEQIADAVIYADDKGKIMRWNHAAAALFGYSAAEALRQKLDLSIPERLRP